MVTTGAMAVPSRKRGVWKTGFFTFAHFLNDSYPNLYPALLPILMVAMHFSVALAGLLSSIAALTTQLLQPVMGLWADRVGTRYFVVGGLMVGSIVSAAALAFSPSYAIFVMALLVAGLGNAAFHPHASALVGELAKSRKGLGMSFFMIGGNFGRALAPIAATTAFLYWGRHGLWILAIPGVVMAGVMWWVMRPAPRPQSRAVHIWTPAFRQGLKHSGNLLVVVMLRNLASMATVTLVPILWHSLHRSLSEAAALLSVLFIVGSLGNMTGGAISDRIGAKPVLIGSAVASTIFLLWFLHAQGIWIWITIGLLGFALYSTGSVVMVAGQSLFPDNKGMASGLTLGVGNTLGALAVGVIGILAKHTSTEIALNTTALLLLLSIPFSIRLRAI
ncbi:MFS transporter, FSR family, fosmidomycin resistance protein [Sulfobacillus thermosulfidooxidans DSM 9293]|uniref:MFS transporter, FSR family, fosmidomycin resistance protein n=2 Tax=Sulfobacillus thermosulfidooxidans TaxID=28034 RepID=A0A1W1WKC3_SULTA|nr:MFS transporter [Sulfobacillus thermosulfidooxidans]PSR29512.1 MAG: MFS transporter [Sulfobacillus thermosulfidooxidans]SMC06716.1 MFS transporter, FSR family, fosmidomycin resistance protein [Sulfobacillus thermosulfidooxidans DSM 9293]